MIVSDSVFRVLSSVLIGGVAALWVLHDAVLLARLAPLRRTNRGDALVADKRFGYTMGIVIGVIGVLGTLRFNGVL
jgi:hypothetical protein